MFATRFIPRAFPALALGAGLMLTACGESPTAPQFEPEVLRNSSVETLITSPDFSPEGQGADETPPVERMPRVRI